MAQHLHQSTAPLVAFMDIGTNSIRLLLVRIHADHSTSVLTQLKHMVRLGDGEFRHHYLQPEAIERAVTVARQFATLARSHGARDIIAVATSATREARNQSVLVRRLRREAHIEVRVVSGPEEARLIYLGVTSGVHLGDKQALFVDIGGGSTEVIVGTQHQYHYLNSLKLGALRLTTRFLPDIQEAIAPRQYLFLKRVIQRHAVHVLRELQAHRLDLAIGSSGTIENLADIATRMFAKRRRQRDDVLTYAHLKKVMMTLNALPQEKRLQVPGLNPQRADIIIAGGAIIEVLMEALDLSVLHITDRGLRDGLLVDYLLKRGHSPLLEGLSVRERSVLQLGRACHFDEHHGRATARLAGELFDSAAAAGLHRLRAWERELLHYAALLHRIGAFLTYDNYQAHSAYFICNANLLGFDQTEVALLAATTMYHRKAMPRKSDPIFAALSKRQQRTLQVLCVLLRLAESLTLSRANRIEHACLRPGDKGTALLLLSANHDCQIEMWGVEKHMAAFTQVFQRRLDMQVIRLEPTPPALSEAETPADSCDPAAVGPLTTPPHPF